MQNVLSILKSSRSLVITGMIVLTATCFGDASKEATANDLSTWQAAVADVQDQLQKSQDNAASELSKASKDLTDQIEKVQAELTGEIQKLADQIQQVQGNLNDLTKKISQ